MEVTSLSYKTLRNSGFLFAGFVLPMLFTIFVTRAMATRLGSAEFGVFLLINAISAFIGYVDLGLGTAVTKYVAEYKAREDLAALRNILSSVRLIFFITGFFGLLVFSVIGKWFLPAFQVHGDRESIFIVFVFAGLVFFFNSLNAIYNAVLSALQRFDLITILGTANLIFVSLGTIALLNFGFQLKAVMALNAAASFFVLLFVRYYSHRLLPQLRLGFILDRAEIVKAYRFGLLAFISNLAGSCLVYLDRLVIPIFLGPSQLAFYSVPGNVALKTAGVTNSLGGMFIPMASALAGTGDMEKLKGVYVRAFRNLSVIAAAITVAIMMFADKILYFWLGAEYASRGTEILMILALTYYLISLYQPLQSILLGLGKTKFLICQSLVMAGVNFILLLVWVPRFGILGAAWAYLFSVLPMIFGFYWVEKNLFELAGRGRDYLALYGKLIFTALISAAIIYFFLRPAVNNVWALAIIGPCSVLLYLLLYFIFRFLQPEDEATFKNFAVKFLRRKKLNT